METGDAELLRAAELQWSTRSHGGPTSPVQWARITRTNPSCGLRTAVDREYGETCAAIASNMLSWRLLLQTGDAKYADLIERTLYNAVMVAPREDGRAFFYANTMHQRVEGTVPPEDQVSARALASLRAPWFEVSCCPTNLARTLASVESVFATMTEHWAPAAPVRRLRHQRRPPERRHGRFRGSLRLAVQRRSDHHGDEVE